MKNKVRLKDGAIKFALTFAKYVLIVALSIAVSSLFSFNVAKWILVAFWGICTIAFIIILGVLKSKNELFTVYYPECSKSFDIIQINKEQLKGKTFDEAQQIEKNYTKQIKKDVSLSSLKGMAIFDGISLILALVLFFAFNNFVWGSIMHLAMLFELCTILLIDAIISLWCYFSYDIPDMCVKERMEDLTCGYGWSRCPNCGGLIIHSISSINNVVENHSVVVEKGSSYTTVSIDKPRKDYLTNTISVNYSTTRYSTPDKTRDYQTTTQIGKAQAICQKCGLIKDKKGIIPSRFGQLDRLGNVLTPPYLNANGEPIKINNSSSSSVEIKEYMF